MLSPSSAAPLSREIVCDESGYEGEKLIGTTTDVFAHGSVDLDEASAAECMRELRARIRSPATQYKANHLLREKHRKVLEWLLGPAGPIQGRAHVYLIDKAFYVLSKLTAFVGGAEDAVTLYREGLGRYGPQRWEEYLTSANDLLRTTPGQLDPLVPAIVRAVDHWGNGAPVRIAHDRQKMLTPQRIEELKGMCPLAELRLVNSDVDARVQVADIVAGAARKIASDELNHRGDPQLTALLRPYVDRLSLWGDERSWLLLGDL